MKICKNCGCELPEGAKFCTLCGTPVEEEFEGTTVLDSNDDAFDYDMDATGLLVENDSDATGILNEEEFFEEKYSYDSTIDSMTDQDSNVNPAFVNPDYQQNSNNQNTQLNSAQQNSSSQTSVVTYERPESNNQNAYQQVVEQPSLKNCYIKFWQNYTNFSGRSRRSEYWFVVLANILISLVNVIPYVGQVLYVIYTLAIIVPALALIVRRLHDLGKEWYNIFFILIPIVGQIMMLVWLCTDSQVGANKFGENPKGIN